MTPTVELPKKFTSYDQAMELINYGLPQMPGDLHAGEFGLACVFDLLKDLGSPQNSIKTVHIAGTSGKGTTAYMIDALLRNNGLKTGLSVSPYVYDMKERWYVNGTFLDEQEILAASNTVLTALISAQAENRLTTRFETIICLAFVLMAKSNVDYFILETGMGGLLDPTNTIERSDKISVLTTIGLDHTHILGNDIAGIAAHKAGIIQPNSEVFSYRQSEAIDTAFSAVADAKSANLSFITPLTSSDILQSDPPQFDRNAALAIAVSNHITGATSVDADKSLAVLRSLTIPGRNERLKLEGRYVTFDGAHNSQKIASAVTAFKKQHSRQEVGVVAVIAKEQQVRAILQQLSEVSDRLIIVGYPDDIVDFKQAASEQTVKAAAEELGIALEFTSYQEAAQHVSNSQRNWLITGSFYHLDWFKKHIF